MSADTIYAVSTAVGKSAVAVIRVSGPAVDVVLLRLCGRTDFVARRATLTRIIDKDGSLLDRGLVVKFDRPNSFTGEPMAEFQVTGGRAVIRSLLEALSECDATRPAEAGEFAKRAFENQKIDLVDVEALADVVEAETRVQLRHAQTLLSGGMGRICEQARSNLLRAMGMLEASLDFSDVEDAYELTIDSLLPVVRETVQDLEQLLRNSIVSERLREGMSVVIAGPPNVGKSTLLNYLARRDVAIVSPMAGTTRDIIDVPMDVEGFPVIFTDTAGIRRTLDPVENEGIARARRKAAVADLVLWLSDGESTPSCEEPLDCPRLELRTKGDLNASDVEAYPGLTVSAKTGQGIEQLLAQIGDFARRHFVGAGSVVAATARQRAAVHEVVNALNIVISDPLRPPELIAEDLRRGVMSLGKITGRVDVEEVLGEIFSRLCVGK